MEVGVQIKKYRNELGLSQEKLAEKVYVSRQTVSNWETGKNYPDIHSLLLLASLFGVSLDQLMEMWKLCSRKLRKWKLKNLIAMVGFMQGFCF